MDKHTEKGARRAVERGESRQQSRGDNRTPDKKIGQVKYADNEAGGEQKSQGGSTRTATLEDDRAQKSQTEGPAAYAPHREDEDIRAFPDRNPAKKKTGEF